MIRYFWAKAKDTLPMRDRPVNVQVVMQSAGGSEPFEVPVIKTPIEGKNVITANTAWEGCTYEWKPPGFKRSGELHVCIPFNGWLRCEFLDTTCQDDRILKVVWAQPYVGLSGVAKATQLGAKDILASLKRLEARSKVRWMDSRKGWLAINVR